MGTRRSCTIDPALWWRRMPTELVFVVDRIARDVVVLVGDDGSEWSVRRHELPSVVEGDVVRAPTSGAEPDWTKGWVDVEETVTRRASARERLRRLKDGDPGGAVSL